MAHGPGSSLTRARREPSAFGGSHAEHSRQLLAFFVRRTFNVEVARDLTAETFALAFEQRRRFVALLMRTPQAGYTHRPSPAEPVRAQRKGRAKGR